MHQIKAAIELGWNCVLLIPLLVFLKSLLDLGRRMGGLMASLFLLTETARKPLAALSRPAHLCQRARASPTAFSEAFVVRQGG